MLTAYACAAQVQRLVTMLYRVTVAVGLGLVLPAAAFSPAAQAPQLRAQALTSPTIAASRLRMMALGGTETVDFTLGELRQNRELFDDDLLKSGRRARPTNIDWSNMRARLEVEFGMSDEELKKYDSLSGDDLLKAYETMQLCRQFENACNQAYMQGHIRGFMHLDNGQETIPALLGDSLKNGDIKFSYYREHTHAISSGVDSGAVMAELCAGRRGSLRLVF